MMSNVTRITPHLYDLHAPTRIRDLPAWVIWRFEDGGEKPRKVPYYASGAKRSGEQGSASDLAGLVTFDAARAAAVRRGFDGVGFATLPQWGVCAVDVDNCVTGGKVHADIEPLLVETYAEFSPSGKGIRLFFEGELGNGKARSAPGTYGLEFFSTAGYVTFTGNAVPGCSVLGLEDTISPLPSALRALHAARIGVVSTEREATSPVGLSEDTIQRALDALDPSMGYDPWLRVGMAIHAETDGKGFELWERWSARSPKWSGRAYDLERWRSFGKRSGGASVTGASLIAMANENGAGISLSGPASPEEFDALVEDSVEQTAEQKPLRFPVLPAHTFSTGAQPAWIIKDVLPQAELVVLYGASGAGKSFLALDLAGAVAQGLPWRGKRTKRGRVVYIAAEGAGGFRKRLRALSEARGVDLATLDLGVIHAAPNFLDKSDAAEVAAAITVSGGAALIIVDTFAQVTAGANENAGEDMGKALGHCKALHRHTGACVMLVHHAGKDSSKGARGWSGIRAACDAELEVVREEAGRLVRLTKQKDGEDSLVWGFDLEVVELGVDEDLDPITSCVVVETAVPTPAPKTPKLGTVERIALDVAEQLGGGMASVEAVISGVVERLPVVPGERDRRREKAKRAVNHLLESAIHCRLDDLGFITVSA
jgi:energy-coupling factor transporter ATP-binding protein EcfA2